MFSCSEYTDLSTFFQGSRFNFLGIELPYTLLVNGKQIINIMNKEI